MFELKTEVYYRFDIPFNIDLAVYTLNKAAHYTPMRVSFDGAKVGESVAVLGYPLGVSLKLSNDSFVTKIVDKMHAFRHELDTFSVNSGSPILNSKFEIIGVHVRGTGANMARGVGRECDDWARGVSGKDFGEANNLSMLKNILAKDVIIK